MGATDRTSFKGFLSHKTRVGWRYRVEERGGGWARWKEGGDEEERCCSQQVAGWTGSRRQAGPESNCVSQSEIER